ncbi:homeobox-domain-containing protein [Peniophora sp. CONT]|nr:homeobox-domain-containing protein [Peniophora sp. CONT]
MKRRRSEEHDEPELPAAQSSPSHDSVHSYEGNIADTETDTRGDRPHVSSSRRSPPIPSTGESSQADAPPPAKKKRTRTLTTPHQSAVLHALLAQSRFPTTAMREEVGRAIGLSARKVQVWFQNQRQKARRPRNQAGQAAEQASAGAVPLTSLPGPSHLPQLSPTSSSAFSGPSSYGATTYGQPSASVSVSRALYEAELALRNSAAAAPSTSLAGPGMPGPSTSQATPFASVPPPSLPRLPGLPSPVSSYGYSGREFTAPLPPPLRYSSPEPFGRLPGPSDSRRTSPEARTHTHRDMAFTLPPLTFDEPRLPRLGSSSSRLPPLDTNPFSHVANRRRTESDLLLESPIAYAGTSSVRRSHSRSPPYPLPGYSSLERPTLPPLRLPSPSSRPHHPLSATPTFSASRPPRGDDVAPSPITLHEPRGVVLSPTISRTTRFDPVRAAISDNEPHSLASSPSPRRSGKEAGTPPYEPSPA